MDAVSGWEIARMHRGGFAGWRSVFYVILLGLGAGRGVSGQGLALSAVAEAGLPTAPSFVWVREEAAGSVSGTVLDGHGAAVGGARVSLAGAAAGAERVVQADALGRFRFTGVGAGEFQVTVSADGFATRIIPGRLGVGEDLDVPAIALRVAIATADVVVTASPEEVAAAQVSAQEKQRVLGVFPNFYVSYVWAAAPMTTKQKFGVALKMSTDPVSLLSAGVFAGIGQAANQYSGYGQGVSGYGKRFGATFADGVIGGVIAGALLPSLLHQDPRYFYKGTGSRKSRVGHALRAVWVCRGDDGKLEPNYSLIVGNLAGAAISNTYYPPQDRHGPGLTVRNAVTGLALGGLGNVFQEFLVKRLTPKLPNYGAATP